MAILTTLVIQMIRTKTLLMVMDDDYDLQNDHDDKYDCLKM